MQTIFIVHPKAMEYLTTRISFGNALVATFFVVILLSSVRTLTDLMREADEDY
jgi:hypothetical protein